MIVKNESKVIKRCLDSVKHLISYWIICDTGSTDNTKEIILEELNDLPGHLKYVPWVNFAYNRTAYMEEAYKLRGRFDYILVMDADEILVDNNFDKKLLSADMYNVRYTGELGYSYPVLFKAQKKWKYEYVTHEIPVADFEGEYIQSDLNELMIDHRHDGGTISEKYTRDIALIKSELERLPGNHRYLFYLAQSYFDISQVDLAYSAYIDRVSAGGWEQEIAYSWYRAGLCIKDTDPAEFLRCMLMSYNTVRKAEPLYEIGKFYNEQKLFHLADLFLSKGLEISAPDNGFFIHLPVYDYLLEIEAAVSKYYIGDFEAATGLNDRAMWSIPKTDIWSAKLIRTNQEFVNKYATSFRQKPIVKYDYDIIFYDDCSMPMSPRQAGAIGGSERIAIDILATMGLRKFNKPILVLSNNPDSEFCFNVKFKHNSYPMDFFEENRRPLRCRKLIHFRYSNIPFIDCSKVLLWTQDMPGNVYEKINNAVWEAGGDILVPSKFAATLYRYKMIGIRIASNFVYPYTEKIPEKNHDQFIYASSAVKGLEQTLDMWIKIKDMFPSFADAKLILCSPGYDNTNIKPEVWSDYSIENLGALGYHEFREKVMESGAMFYVNTFPETFGISPYTAHLFGLPVHILCKNGFGALKEIMPYQFITDDNGKFIQDVMRVYAERKNGIFAQESVVVNNYQQQITTLANELTRD